MVRVCEGTTTKQEMLERSLDQYKEMFVIVKREFEMVTAVCETQNLSFDSDQMDCRVYNGICLDKVTMVVQEGMEMAAAGMVVKVVRALMI